MARNKESRELQTLQAQIEEADRAYNSLLDAVGDSIFFVSYPDMKIVNLNSHAARRLGYTPDELIGKPFDDLEVVPPEDFSEMDGWTSYASGTNVYECLLRHRDGTMLPVEVSSRLVHYNGKAVLLKAGRDITVRKGMELTQKQLIADLETYAHSVAHDLKNPIGMMMGYSELILNDPDHDLPGETGELVEIIHKSAVRMLGITNALLKLAEIQKMDEIETGVLNMEEITSEALDRLANIIDSSGAKVFLPEQWPAAIGYAPWVEEVLANYLSNAIKYGGDPPVIEVGARRFDDGFVRVEVRDNGIGISEEDQAELFIEFNRFNKNKAEGHGLGLSIVKRIVNKLGGEVSVSSQPGKGSTFMFTLPSG